MAYLRVIKDLCAAIACVALVFALASCGEQAAPQTQKPSEMFTEVSRETGLVFQHVNGMTGEFHFAEMMGPGIALFDYDNDGDLDVLVVQGGSLSGDSAGASPLSGSARLFRNDLVVRPDGTRELRFTDVTEQSKLLTRGYGMGVATGDIDNDGFIDVFLTFFGAPSRLFHNNGDGTFSDVSAAAGVSGDGAWGVSATFFDFDRDGFLDLYVANYVDFTMKRHKPCFASDSSRDYCSPKAYRPVPGRLYRNRGNGTFQDVSEQAGIRKVFGSALGVIAADLNEDGWPDLYVANDGNENQLWINQRNGTFRDEAAMRGSALNADGAAEAGMGVDIADADGDGDDDIFLTHLTGEKSTLYVNLGKGMFEDGSVASNLAGPSRPFTGFGTAFIDYDNDGLLDIVTANGAVQKIAALAQRGDPFPLRQRKQLYRNLGERRFAEVSQEAGQAFALSEVGRGLAVGDLDNDGDTDIVVANNNGPARVFINNVGNRNGWAGLRLMTGNRDAYGARIEVIRKRGPRLVRRVRADGSYLSANDPRVLVGLAGEESIERVKVSWPDGTQEEFTGMKSREYTTIRKGKGRSLEVAR
jgi:hypothetical protein